jgi:glyoxylase-like metal-dependent hydrolase (beta-lactamase superfamily II)
MCVMARAGRRFVKFLLFLILLLVIGVLGLNVFRLHFDNPEPVAGSVTRVHNGFVDFYAAKNGARVILFDAGTDPLGRGVDAMLASMSAGREQIKDVFFTHGHGDHLAAASLLGAASFHAGAKDVGLIDGSNIPLKQRVFNLLMPVSGVKVDQALDGKMDVNVGEGQMLKAIPVPGHTPGSYFYLWEKVLFVGDTINYQKGELTLPPESFNADTAQLKQSVAGLGKTLAGYKFERICTGHGGCTPPAETKKLLDDLIKKMQ